MSEATQTYLTLGSGGEATDNGFYSTLDYIRENANTQYGKGRLFERLIRAYLLEDPFYQKRFSEVYLWAEWTERRPEFDGVDIGIDLVAAERNGGYCAIQCKCYAENTRISKGDLDTFISASAREPFTARMFVDTGSNWSPNLYRTLDGLQPPCQRVSAADLASRPVDWPDLSREAPEQLDYQQETFNLREHQKTAFDDVINGFKASDLGKLIMACGTGKTFTALRIAEDIAGVGGRVLYLVPSIGLFSQAMREWAEQQTVPHRYIGICSDTKAGKTAEDASILELEIPVTTDPTAISEALEKDDKASMKVVFCTYHSLPIVEAAQDAGAPAFDMVLCDEAHRTTGIEDGGDKTSPFVLVHDTDRIRAKKRLYMTATSRLYTEGAKAKAARHDIEVFSMDDSETYGPEFHRLPFSRAVEQDLLSDYKVVVLAMSEQDADAALQTYRTSGGSEININDATKIVGGWRALQNPERKAWESWAADVADIFSRIVGRVESLLDTPENEALQEWFADFHAELKSSINAAITRKHAIDMMAQHILTRPVFEALFENYDFASGNPVSIALDKLRNDFAEFGLEDETRDLAGFYESVRMRARGIDNSEGRQRVLLELYEKFFQKALKKDADRLGIVYTPVEVVDFILHSANEVLQDEFGRCLSDEGVHILDPFTGAGIFLARLLQSQLIQPDDLERKYREELHANEIVLLAYYIAAVNIEEAFHGKHGADKAYEPFNGIVLTDTFNLNKGRNLFPKEWIPDNNERVERQQQLPIGVIVGNPPWSAGQKSAADDNPNVDYPELEKRVRETYVEAATVTNKNRLYDTYKMAIRWASDRIDKQGIIAFVTNGSWIDGNAEAGIRACLAEEFSSIHVLNLRGNQRTQGEVSRREGGKVFGSGSRAPVAITLLVKNANAAHKGCKIHYRDIGDSLKREEKLQALTEAKSIKGFSDWQTITPDEHHDWIEQRSREFVKFYPMGSKDAKAGKTNDAIFELYSRGVTTGRDAYIYNLSRDACAANANGMTQDYLAALSELEKNPGLTADVVANQHRSNTKWDSALINNLRRKEKIAFDEGYTRKVAYRPFVATNCYADYTFIQSKYQMDRIFPNSSSENRAICVPCIGTKKPFSALVTDTMSDLNLQQGSQCFPRYRYPKATDTSDTTLTFEGIDKLPDRIDNISDTALHAFREHYNDDAITKDAIFDYVYGVLHAPSYREAFANDLSKMIPRIPFAPDFHTFAAAGVALADLHLNYETCEQYPLQLVYAHDGEPQPHHFQLGTRAMRFTDKETKTTLILNEHVSLSGIPETAHRYIVNGRTPLEWFIDRYKITQDKDSGIINDPNGWFADPRDLVTAIERIVYISVESERIIEGLPSELTC